MAAANQGAKITLYWLEKSRAQRILWLLEELNLSYDLKIYKRGEYNFAPPELKQVHPLGKSPIITIESPATPRPLVLAESGVIVEYLCDHFGGRLVPRRYAEGKEGQVGGETESWLRYRYYMHYAEGSLMPLALVQILLSNIKNAPVPFFIKPVTRMIAGKLDSIFLQKNLETHFAFLESQIKSSPDGGQFLCGRELTAADILMSFPLIAMERRSGITRERYPELAAYIGRLKETEGYKRAAAKIEEVEGSFTAVP